MGKECPIVQMAPVASMGAQGEGPQGAKLCKFQTSSSPEPEGEKSQYFACRYLQK